MWKEGLNKPRTVGKYPISSTAATLRKTCFLHTGERLSTEKGCLSTPRLRISAANTESSLAEPTASDPAGRPAGPDIRRALPSRKRGAGKAIDREASVGVDELADRSQLTPQLVVDAHLAIDLVAGVQHRGVVSSTQFGADAKQ